MTQLYWFAVLKINCPSHIRCGTQNCLPSPSKKKTKKSLSPIFHALFTQQPQHNHSKAAIHHCHCHPRRFSQLHQQLRSKACLKGSCHQRRRAGRTCQTCLVKTLRIKPQVCLWSAGQRTRVKTWTVGHVTPVLSPLDWGVYLRQRHQP